MLSVDSHLLSAGERGEQRDGEKKERRQRETGRIERAVSRSSKIKAEPFRGFWLQKQYQASGGWK